MGEMTWDLEEKVEDAFVSYLKAQLIMSGNLKVYEGYSNEEIAYPCTVVMASGTGLVDPNVVDVARTVSVELAVATEAAAIVDGTGKTVKTARKRNAEARAGVLACLNVDNLAALLEATNTPGVAFSEATVNTTKRDNEGRLLVTIITVDVIAQPKEE